MSSVIRKIKRVTELCSSKMLWFNKIGKRSSVIRPMQINNPQNISIGNYVTIYDYSWLMGSGQKNSISLFIDDGTTIGHFSHIIATHSVKIGKNVLIADKVFITDCTHNYEDVTVPIAFQGIKRQETSIGDDTWIGENVCVLAGVSIGKHCVIGANAVVKDNIPDYSVAVGFPAKVVKRFNHETSKWEKIISTGEK